jgi:ribonuclease P/MRP protein subunit POP5
MDRIPAKNGRSCTFRVMRVSGTIRKIEEDAVRRAKQMMLAAKEAAESTKDPASSALGALFGASGQQIDAMELDVDSTNEAEDDDAGD